MNPLEIAQLLHFAAHIKEDARETWIGLVVPQEFAGIQTEIEKRIRAWWTWLDSQPDPSTSCSEEVRQ